jgi:hypothetical protein
MATSPNTPVNGCTAATWAAPVDWEEGDSDEAGELPDEVVCDAAEDTPEVVRGADPLLPLVLDTVTGAPAGATHHQQRPLNPTQHITHHCQYPPQS